MMPMVDVVSCDYPPAHSPHDWEWRGSWVWCPGRVHALQANRLNAWRRLVRRVKR